VSGQLDAPAALPPGKEPRYPLYRRLGGPQSQSGRCGEEKILHPTGTQTSNSRVIQPIASRYTYYDLPFPCKWDICKYLNLDPLPNHSIFSCDEELNLCYENDDAYVTLSVRDGLVKSGMCSSSHGDTYFPLRQRVRTSSKSHLAPYMRIRDRGMNLSPTFIEFSALHSSVRGPAPSGPGV
jgi:hypothetical protein